MKYLSNPLHFQRGFVVVDWVFFQLKKKPFCLKIPEQLMQLHQLPIQSGAATASCTSVQAVAQQILTPNVLNKVNRVIAFS